MVGIPQVIFILTLSILSPSVAQQASETYEQEQGPKIDLRVCTAPGSCNKLSTKLTMDSNWRWIHKVGTYKNCYTGNEWNTEYCPDPDTCAKDCALEGASKAKYEGTYGVEEIPNGISMKFVSKHKYGVNVGSRLFFMAGERSENYYMFKLKNEEIAFDADMSQLECGMNGAVYLIEMDENGGKGKNSNAAGAKFGTGYCDAQCPHDIKFVDGKANNKDWQPNPKDKSGNMGNGHYGICCNEMDIWEANSMSNAFTPHPCLETDDDSTPIVGAVPC